MGSKSHMEPYGFSAALNAYLKKVLADNGRDDLSGRWLDEVTGRARSYDYWSKLVKDSRAMTTNDIQVLAQTFGISPYEWVANARRHAAGQHTFPLSVRGAGEDEYEQKPTHEQAIPTRKAAKRAPLKSEKAFRENHEGSTDDGGESRT